MSEKPPVTTRTQYTTTVPEMADAWAFVMSRLDSVGPDPEVHIEPVWTTRWSKVEGEDRPDEFERWFSVAVSGSVEENDPA